jgi:hypothetical protein
MHHAIYMNATHYTMKRTSHGYVVIREFADGSGETRGTFTTRKEALARKAACELAESLGFGEFKVAHRAAE